jgi:sodium-dependent dicarboxylate transporter 2/3/5
MWMSNVAAAALLLAALGPVLHAAEDPRFRKALLLAVAMGANRGGMATPLGSGPNGIAIAATRTTRNLDFLDWMSFGVPIVLGMLVLAAAALTTRYGVRGSYGIELYALQNSPVPAVCCLHSSGSQSSRGLASRGTARPLPRSGSL